jgi:hypothetical protein
LQKPSAGMTHYQSDRAGSPEVLTDRDGIVRGTSDYGAFGEVRASDGTQPALGYGGAQHDTESGLLYSPGGYYDPGVPQRGISSPALDRPWGVLYETDLRVRRVDPQQVLESGRCGWCDGSAACWEQVFTPPRCPWAPTMRRGLCRRAGVRRYGNAAGGDYGIRPPHIRQFRAFAALTHPPTLRSR